MFMGRCSAHVAVGTLFDNLLQQKALFHGNILYDMLLDNQKCLDTNAYNPYVYASNSKIVNFFLICIERQVLRQESKRMNLGSKDQ